MRALSSSLLIGLTAIGPGVAAQSERNHWPVRVEESSQSAEGRPQTATSWAGPLLFSQPLSPLKHSGATRASGFRPLFVQTTGAAGETVQASVLYPLFTYRQMTDGYRWSVFSIINHYSTDAGGESARQRGFDLWPVYYSRDTGSPESSYWAVFPLYGSVPNRFGQDRLTFVGFPLYARWEKNNVTTTTAPWPIIKVLNGEGNRGFELWPLFGQRQKEGAYREQFYLWPLIYKKEARLWEEQPDVKLGFLPFYTRASDAQSRSESFLWPFFGYSDRVAPYRYHQVNYFWPIWVQGRGDERYVNRWGPFYSHSSIKGVDKTWVGWPVWKKHTWVDGGLRHTRRQILFFLYNDNEQSSASNPALPSAHRTHLWPLYSVWDNGAGRRQVQALSPFEVFFPHNDHVRLAYSPLAAVYRYDRNGDEQVHHSVLWNLVSYRRQPDRKEFHLGPLFSSESAGAAKRYALGNGVLALSRRPETGRWRFSFFDFKRRPAPVRDGNTAP